MAAHDTAETSAIVAGGEIGVGMMISQQLINERWIRSCNTFWFRFLAAFTSGKKKCEKTVSL